MSKPHRRFAFAHLEHFITMHYIDDSDTHYATVGKKRSVTMMAIADWLDVDRTTVHRWVHNGLTTWTADVVAVRLGVHPCDIWPDFYEDVA